MRFFMKENQYRLRMHRIASSKDPEKLAYYVYFIMKQCPESAFCNEYRKSLMYMSDKLINEHDWSLLNVAEFVRKLAVLSRHIRSSPIDKNE